MELLVVIAIAALLTSILVPALNKAKAGAGAGYTLCAKPLKKDDAGHAVFGFRGSYLRGICYLLYRRQPHLT